ncbi:MAG: hypothetical protein ACYDBJ_11640 [Aggregatilineales bacterium]
MANQKKPQPKGKKKTGQGANKQPRKQTRQTAERAVQREWLKLLRQEVDYLDDISVMIMTERGILPPFYGGVELADQSEVIPLWGIDEHGEEDLGLLFLRSVPEAETAASLREARDEMALTNDLAIADVFASIQSVKPINIEGSEELADQMITLALAGSQIDPAPGQTIEQTLDHIGEGLPFAAFVHIPVKGDPSSEDEDAFDYDWDELENYRIEILCADSLDDLEVAVWKYRLDLALLDELADMDLDEQDEEALLFLNAAELAGVFDAVVLDGMRYYGVTSPVRAKQTALDILREDDDALVVRPPLKPEIEPVKALAERRVEIQQAVQLFLSNLTNAMPPIQETTLVRLEPWGEQFREIWTDVRAHPYYALDIHKGTLKIGASGKLNVNGYASTPTISWIVADSLPELYERVTLFSLRRMLAALGYLPWFTDIGDEIDTVDLPGAKPADHAPGSDAPPASPRPKK